MEKIKKIFIVPYCHADWAWTHTRLWHEKRYALVFNEVLDIMRDNKDFKWYMDTFITHLEPFLRLCPERVNELKERVKEGRIAVCGTYTNLRPNMVGEETFIRDIIYGKREFRNIFHNVELSVYAGAVDVAVGHPQIPQLLNLAGYKYFRFWRPHASLSAKNIPYEFYWIGPDGSKILCSRGSYSGLVSKEIWTEKEGFKNNWKKARESFYESEIDYAAQLSPTGIIWLSQGTDDTRPLRVIGIGEEKSDLLEFVEEWNRKEKTPLCWATPIDYFNEIEISEEKISEIKGTIDPADVSYNTAWNGPSGLWNLRIHCDEQLTRTEKLLTIAEVFGYPYPQDKIETLWKNLLLFSAHATQWLFKEDFEEIYSLATKTKMEIEDIKKQAVGKIVSQIKSEKKPEAIIFNFLEFPYDTFVKITISSVDKNIDRQFVLKDSKGKQLEYQIINYLPGHYRPWEVEAIVNVSLPPLGYTCIYPEEKNSPMNVIMDTEGTSFSSTELKKLKNEALELAFDNGYLKEINLKKSEKEYKSGSIPFGFLKIYHMDPFDPKGCLHIGKFIKEESVVWNRWWKKQDGNLRKVFCTEGKIGKHSISMDTVIYKGQERIDFEVECEYLGEENAFIVFSVPLDFFNGEIYGDIPFGIEKKSLEKEPYGRVYGKTWDNIERLIEGMFFAKSFVDYSDGQQGISIIPHNGDRYYVWNKDEKVLSHIMLRGFKSSDNWNWGWEKDITEKIEGKGLHKLKYTLYFHSKGGNESKIYNIAKGLRTPPGVVQRFPVFSGNLPDVFSFLSVEPENIIVTALYREKESIFLRLYEIEGKQTKVKISLPFLVKKAQSVNFSEENIKQEIQVKNKEILFTIHPYQITTIKMEV